MIYSFFYFSIVMWRMNLWFKWKKKAEAYRLQISNTNDAIAMGDWDI